MTTKFIQIALLLIFLAGAVYAYTPVQHYESAATARIVGNSPEDMAQQLRDTSKIDLEKGIYVGYSSQPYSQEDSYEIIKKLFSDFMHEVYPEISDIRQGLESDKDNLLVINPPTKKPSMSKIEGINSTDFEGISSTLKRNDNLIVLNSPYSGLYVPYRDSLVASISPNSNMIAPMSYSSDMFLRSFLCNINKYSTIGEAYRQARNNYYWHTDNEHELIGLTLMSYMFYGMPTRTLKAPTEDVSSYCKDYHNEYPKASQLSVSAASKQNNEIVALAESGVYKKNKEFRIGNYSILQIENYSIIETDVTENSFDFSELVLPSQTIIESFPVKTIITGFNVTEMSEPIELTLPNLPEFNGFNYINRNCYEDSKEAAVKFSKVYTDDSVLVLAKISPVEVINCTEGKFRLYKQIKYSIDYFPYSPVMIESIDSPSLVQPNQELKVSVKLRNIQTSKIIGYLTITDENGRITDAKEVDSDTGIVNMAFYAPEKEGEHTYRVDFYQEASLNESKTYKEFKFKVSTIELALITPTSIDSQDDATLIVSSSLNTTVELPVRYTIKTDNKIESSKNEVLTIEPGINEFMIDLGSIDRKNEVYDVLAEVHYLNDLKTASARILTEHVPVIIQDNIEIKENESLTISPRVYDLDNDKTTVKIEYPFDYNESWVASFESSGMYEINITADDGIKESKKTILLKIKNVNRPPILEDIENVTLKEGENLTITPTFSDPDNLNSVTNDDNNLTISYSELFDENGSINANFESSGNYIVYATVSDGDATDTKAFNLEIKNTNREPMFTTKNITIHENETLDIHDIIFDPDNNNSVTNDDNNLSVITDKLFDANGIWFAGFNDSGSYNVSVNVSDGEFTKSETVSINVINVNRAPQISSSAKDVYYIDENSDLSLEVFALDPDDDSVQVKWYVNDEEKAQSNAFTFKPEGVVGNFEIKAIASDGDLSSTKTINVIVSDVPVLSGFDGSTTLIEKSKLSSVYPFILEKVGKARVMFKQPVDLTKTVDFVSTVSFDDSYVSLDSNFLDALKNVPAHITLYNIATTQNPVVYYDEQFAKNKASISKVCPSSICSNIVYSNTTLDFDVSHFSTFWVNESSQNQFDILSVSNITLYATPNESINYSITIKNNGLAELDNLRIEGVFNEGIFLEVLPKQASLLNNQSITVYITGNSPILPSKTIEKIGEIKLKASDLDEIIPVYLKQKETFYIKGVSIISDNQNYTDLSDKDIINLTMPEFTVDLNIE